VYGTNNRACKRSAHSALFHLQVRRADGALPPPDAGTPHRRTTGRMLERGPHIHQLPVTQRLGTLRAR
ncbi:hypothetical protein FOMPIDRAFT_1026195, partial [Fomitopsis schrenkii]